MSKAGGREENHFSVSYWIISAWDGERVPPARPGILHRDCPSSHSSTICAIGEGRSESAPEVSNRMLGISMEQQ